MIYDRFVRVVHGIVLGTCAADEAEDLTQDVFLTIQQKLDTVDDAAALPGWICTIARNAAIDRGRRNARRPRLVELPAELPELPARGERSDAELAERMLERLRELPEAFRESLTLRLVEGLTGPEIAAATGMTPGSVRVNLHRGMTLLRDLLQKDGWP